MHTQAGACKCNVYRICTRYVLNVFNYTVFEGNLQKPRLEGSTKAFRRRGFVGTPRHNIYRHFSDRFGAMAVVVSADY